MLNHSITALPRAHPRNERAAAILANFERKAWEFYVAPRGVGLLSGWAVLRFRPANLMSQGVSAIFPSAIEWRLAQPSSFGSSRDVMQEPIPRWSAAAPYWEKHRAIIRAMFAPVTQALVEAAQIGRGSAVLDVATGPGEPALTIAELVGSEGKVLGIDAVAEMAEAARREAQRRGLGNASFAVTQADALPAKANSFDAVVSRFGIMFFPAPVLAVREMLRVLKPGGRIALAVWYGPERNPFHYIPARVIERYVSSPPPAPDAPSAFRFTEPGKLRAVLSEAGVSGISERILNFWIRAPVASEEFWTLRTEMSDKLRNDLAKIPKRQMAEAKRAGVEAVRPYSRDDGIHMPAEVLIVMGAKPRF